MIYLTKYSVMLINYPSTHCKPLLWQPALLNTYFELRDERDEQESVGRMELGEKNVRRDL